MGTFNRLLPKLQWGSVNPFSEGWDLEFLPLPFESAEEGLFSMGLSLAVDALPTANTPHTGGHGLRQQHQALRTSGAGLLLRSLPHPLSSGKLK